MQIWIGIASLVDSVVGEEERDGEREGEDEGNKKWRWQYIVSEGIWNPQTHLSLQYRLE